MSAGRGRRTGIVLILLIVVVLIIGVVAVFALQGLGGGGGPAVGQQPTEVPPTPPPVINIIVAARDIPRGARLSAQDVTTMAWPILVQAPPPAGALLLENGGLEQVEGRIARVDILNGQPIMDFMITPGDQPTSLANVGSDAALLIPSGMVAVSIPITRLNSVGYALRAGDHVDILMSFRFIDVDPDFQTMLPNHGILFVTDPQTQQLSTLEYTVGREETGLLGNTVLIVPNEDPTQGQIARQTTQLVIDNAIVVRVGTWPITDLEQPIVVTVMPQQPTPTPSAQQVEGQPTPTPIPSVPVPDIITLAMSRQDALVLKYASEVGAVIDLALRSALDNQVSDVITDPVSLDYIINFYNVAVPQTLPVAIDPRAEAMGLLNTLFQQSAAEATPPQ
jgi:pilus assembly protein CpaB